MGTGWSRENNIVKGGDSNVKFKPLSFSKVGMWIAVINNNMAGSISCSSKLALMWNQINNTHKKINLSFSLVIQSPLILHK